MANIPDAKSTTSKTLSVNILAKHTQGSFNPPVSSPKAPRQEMALPDGYAGGNTVVSKGNDGVENDGTIDRLAANKKQGQTSPVKDGK